MFFYLKYFKQILVTGLIALLVTSCTQKNIVSTNELNIPLKDEVSTLDPANSYDSISGSILYQVGETLLEYHYLKRPFQLQPLLAEEMPTISKDGRVIHFKLKKGVFYHPSKAFTGPREMVAKDFLFQIKRLAFIPLKSQGAWLFNGILKGFTQFREKVGSDYQLMKTEQIEGFKIINDHEFEFHLERPYKQFIYGLSMSFVMPVPEELADYYKNDLSRNIIGTGPFVFKSWDDPFTIILEKNSNYRKAYYPSEGDRESMSKKLINDSGKQIPFIDRVTFKVIKESQTRWLQFLRGKIDILILAKEHLQSVIDKNGVINKDLQKKGIEANLSPTLTYWWLGHNMNDSILGKNLALRKAIASAIDIDKFIQIFTNNTGLKANSIIPPGVPGYSPGHQAAYPYDIKQAEKYLEEAGYPKGKGLPVFKFDLRSADSNARQMAEFFQSELAKIGIQISASLNTFPAYLQKAKKGQLQFFLDGWAMDYPDPENSLLLLTKRSFPPGPNTTYFTSERIEDIYQKLTQSDADLPVDEFIQESNAIIKKELPWIMLYYQRDYHVNYTKIHNFRPSEVVRNYLKYIRIK